MHRHLPHAHRRAARPCGLLLATFAAGLLLVGHPAPAAAEDRDGPDVIDVEDLALQVNRIALAVWSRLHREPGNLALSPLSLASLLAAVADGGEGRTAADAAKAARFGMDGERLRRAFAGLRSQTLGADKGARVRVADALWLPAETTPPRAFAGAAEAALGLHVAPLAGADAFARSRAVGAWVQEHTDGAFAAAARPDDVAAGLAWTSAVHVDGGWGRPFRLGDTERATFHTADGREVSIGLMKQVGPFGYARTDGVRVLEVMYATGAASLVVIMPEAGSLAAVEKKLSPERLERWLQAVRVQDVRLLLPRFRITTRTRLDDALRRNGLRRAFGKRCGLGGIAAGDACLGAALQVARFETRESVPDAETKRLKPPPLGAMPPLEYRADRPFLFLVRHNATGAILFLGRLANPRA